MGCFSIGFFGLVFFFVSIWLFDSLITGLIVLGAILALFVLRSWLASQKQLKQAARLLHDDFSNGLTAEAVELMDKTAVLYGHTKSKVRVVETVNYLDNLQEVLNKAQSEVPETLELVADLVTVQENGKNKVIVTMAGLRLGSVADIESEDIFKEIFEIGGLARADAEIIREEQLDHSKINLCIERPIRPLNKYQIQMLLQGKKVKGINK